MAASRHLVAESLVKDYTDLLAQRADRITVGNPVEADVGYGPLIDTGARDRVHQLVEDSVRSGARLVTGGLRLSEKVPAGMVHINDQTIADEAIAPFGGVGLSGNGFRAGGLESNLDAFTEQQWVTAQARPGSYPF